ncbi:MAG: 2,3-bisphosphoglycerate-independent phosphoglycerate mutase [Planctomycetota bacterium]|nr:MAG: 2,3-bisphosphoglycerate-independent phosphoglycerate mutase [Planctomycetota bacterium]
MLPIIPELAKKTGSKIILYVMDGMSGLPGPGGKTEMETANLPNMDRLARISECGLIDPVGRGITPGSGPGHLSLFGYNPVENLIGRGALAAAGIGFPIQPGDVAARINFCTLDEKGNIVDRRAGRIPTEKNQELMPKLREIKIPDVEIFCETVREYRSVVIFRGEGLGPDVGDTDPQATGVPPLTAMVLEYASKKTADIANEFIEKAMELLKDESPANGILTRGYSGYPELQTYQELYKLTPAAIATYPMYRGVARFAGMDILGADTIENMDDELSVLEANWEKYDFFFIHYKYTDSRGEDGDFEAKAAELEKADAAIERLLALEPDALAVAGDHTTPAVWKAHSWHASPVLLHGAWCRHDNLAAFTENECARGSLGRFPGWELMPLMLSSAGKLEKYGA